MTIRRRSEETPSKSEKSKQPATLVSAGEAAPPVDVEALDKKALRKTLKALGGTYDEGDSEKALRKKATKLMASTKVLNPRAVDGVVATLPDCKGLFLDPTTIMCQKCPERADCKVKFDENVKNNFPQIRRTHVDKALDSVKKSAPAAKSGDKVNTPKAETKAPKSEAKKEKAEASGKPKVIAAAKTKDGKTLTFDRPIKIVGEHPKDNPYKKGEDVYPLVKAMLTKRPKTIGELVAIYGTLYELPKKPSAQLAESVNMIDWLRESEIVRLQAPQK